MGSVTDVRIEDFLEFKPKKDKIFFNKERMLLFQAHAMIAKTLEGIIHSPVIILNRYCRVSSCMDKDNLFGKKPKTFLWQLTQQQAFKDIWSELVKSPKSIRFTPTIDNKKFPFLLLPITTGGGVIKGLVLVLENNTFSELDMMTIEYACTACGLEFLKEEAVLEAEMRVKSDFIDDLLKSTESNYPQILSRAVTMGYDLEEPHLIMVTDVRVNVAAERKQNTLQEIMEGIALAMKNLNSQSIITIRRNQLIVILNISHLSEQGKKDIANTIIQWTSTRFPNCFVNIGIGSKCSNPIDYRRSWNEAMDCVKMMRTVGLSNSIKYYYDLGIYGILWDSSNKEKLERFSHSRVGPLIDYDKKHNSNLVRTLKLYLNNCCNLRKTAEDVFIHVSTLKYRIKKIQDLIGLELSNQEVRFQLEISIRILETLEVFKEEPS